MISRRNAAFFFDVYVLFLFLFWICNRKNIYKKKKHLCTPQHVLEEKSWGVSSFGKKYFLWNYHATVCSVTLLFDPHSVCPTTDQHSWTLVIFQVGRIATPDTSFSAKFPATWARGISLPQITSTA